MHAVFEEKTDIAGLDRRGSLTAEYAILQREGPLERRFGVDGFERDRRSDDGGHATERRDGSAHSLDQW